MGKFSISPYASVEKFGYFRGMTNVYGIGGIASYQFSDRLWITAFGSTYTHAQVPNPVVAAFIPTSSFGGFLTWNFNRRWSLDMGARHVFRPDRGRWETIPILTPQYAIGGKHKIGIDVGGIIYEILSEKLHKQSKPFVPKMGPGGRPMPNFSGFKPGPPTSVPMNRPPQNNMRQPNAGRRR